MTRIKLHCGYIPGAIGRVAELHARYYHAAAGFGVRFEAKVARELAEFCERYDATRDGLWLALDTSPAGDGRQAIEGSIVIDGLRAETEGAHLRWFMVSDRLRGRGVGRELLGAAIASCRERRYPSVWLWTFAGLDAARHLYERFGFRLVHQQRGRQWGTEVDEQRFELRW